MVDPVVVESDERLVIHAPVGAVERMLIDAGARPQWRTRMLAQFESSDPLMRPGTTLHFVVRRFGMHSEYIQIVSEYLPGSRLVCRTTKGMFFVDTVYEWDGQRGTTRLRCYDRLHIPHNKRAARWLVAWQFRRQLRKDHRKLAHLLETGTQRYLAPSELTGDAPRRESMQGAGDQARAAIRRS